MDQPIDLGRIRALADAFDASDWDEVHVVVDGVEVHLSALPQGDTAPAPIGSEGHVRSAESSEGSLRSESAPAPNPGDGNPSPANSSDGALRSERVEHAPPDAPPDATGTAVGAPSPGIFWRAPSPGAAPFVQVGDRVEVDTVVGIVELMKLMNRVAAGVAGTVSAVLVANGESVDKGGSLVLIDPS